MSEYMTLLGTEEVSRAASRMSEAAAEMNRAASSMEVSLFQHQRFLDEWLQRFEEVFKRGKENEEPKRDS